LKRKTLKIDKLTVHVFDSREEMGQAAAKDAELRINSVIDKKGEATVVFAAAPSQNELLAELKKAKVDWTKVRAMHMDEYIGLPEDHPARFGNFLRRAIFDDLPFKSVYYLYQSNAEAEEICQRYSKLLTEYPPDVILLGVGENGHLAFNDPEVADFNDPQAVKIVELDEICRQQQVNDGCFKDIHEVPKKAITLTMSTILSIQEAIAVVPGKNKAKAIDRMLHGEISTECPASILRKKENAALYLDKESAVPAISLQD